MNLTSLLTNALMQFWFVIPFFILVAVIKSAWFKGILGEFQVNLLLKIFLAKDQYTLIKNVTLPTDDGTTQIDHILVSRFGVFVVETKNMKGWIFGNPKQKQWTQKIFKYSGKFQNPLHQNYKHTQTLASSLNLSAESIYSVIVFIGDSTFKTKMPENVTYARGCVKYIKSKTTQHFSQEQVGEIIQAIEAGRLSRGLKTNLQHNRHVQNIINHKVEMQTQQPAAQKEIPAAEEISQTPVEPVCKKCGSAMILRRAKKGNNAGNEFWGCSNFPKCRVVGVVG